MASKTVTVIARIPKRRIGVASWFANHGMWWLGRRILNGATVLAIVGNRPPQIVGRINAARDGITYTRVTYGK